MTVEQKIKKYFDDHFLLQSAYAKKAGISASRFSRILNGRTKVTADEFLQISEALKISMDELSHYGDESEA